MSLILTSKVNKKLEGYGKNMKNAGEIGGLIFGKFITNGDIKVFDIIILNQIKSAITFSINEDDMMDITKNYSGKKLSQIIGWWHSHGNMLFTDFSTIDDDTFKRLSNLSGICVGILINFDRKWKNMYIKGRVDTMTKLHGYISINDITPQIEQDFIKIVPSFFINDINSKVKEDKRIKCNCPQCKGMGFIYDYGEGYYLPNHFVPKHKAFDDEEEDRDGPYTKKIRDLFYG